MKKFMPFILGILLACGVTAQDTLTGWTFPVNSGPDSLNANLGLLSNSGYDIRFEGVDTTYNTIFFTDGVSNFAASAAGWDNGMDEKFWSIKFKAENYTTVKVSSKQSSDALTPGPRDFKLQWRLSGEAWQDISGGNVTVGNDWTTGIVVNLPVPVTTPGTTSIYIRWILTSNVNTNGGTLDPTGISKIDDILVTGVSTIGINQIIFSNQIRIIPNPNQGTFEIQSSRPLSCLIIVDMMGRTIWQENKPQQKTCVTLDVPAGSYFLKVQFVDINESYTMPIIVL